MRYTPPWNAAVAGGLLLAFAGTADAADPFYERLLQDGVHAYSQGDYAAAVHHLRLACFGLLDEPATLAGCLTHLALAQAATGDAQSFATTFRRILEIEQRFEAFSKLAPGAELRRELERHLELWISYEVLRSAPVFSTVARRKLEARILALPPPERRGELTRRLEAEPDDPTWLLWSAELDLVSDPEAALATVENALAGGLETASARCLRGRALIALGRCEPALAELASCEADPSLAEPRLRCRIQLEDWDGAESELAALPAGEQQRSPFRRLAREVRQGRKQEQAARQEESPQEAAEVQETGLEETPAATEAAAEAEAVGQAREEVRATAPPETPPEVRREIEAARGELRSGSRRQLETAFGRLRDVADGHPRLAEPQYLAGEMAYRLARWDEAVTYFQRGSELASGRPEQLFYYSVALYETGAAAAAADTLERCLPQLQKTDFVLSYAAKIHGAVD